MKNQSETPNINGLAPTDLITDRERPAPIKKRVNVRHCLAVLTIP